MQTKVVVRRFVFAAACAALLFGLSGCGGGGAGGGTAILPVAPTGAGAPPAAATSGSRVVSTAQNSKATGATYPIQFYLPPGYDDGASTYPTIYITDGDAVYNLGVTRFKNFTDIFEKAGKKAIVVGVGGTARRNTDYLPPGASISRLPHS